MAALGRLIGQLYKDFGKPAVDEVLSVLGRDAEPEMIKKAVAQRAKAAAPEKPAAKVEKAPAAKARFTVVREGAPKAERPLAQTRKPMRETAPQLPPSVTGSFNAMENVPVSYKGTPINELSDIQMADFGESLDVPNIGPLTPSQSFPYEGGGGQRFDLPGGTEGTFTLEDMFAIKGRGIDPSRIDPGLHQAIQRKLMRSMAEPDGLSDARALSGLTFGFTSPNNPLTPNELATARLRLGSMEDVDRLVGMRPWSLTDPVTAADRSAFSDEFTQQLGLNAASKGGLGVRGSVDYSGYTDLLDLFRRDPAFFHKGKKEDWTTFVERVASQVPGLSSKTGSFGVAWQPEAGVSAIDRHMALEYMDTILGDPARSAAFKERALNLARAQAREAGREGPSRFEDINQGVLVDVLLGEVGKGPTPKLRTKSGEISSSVPESLRGVDWISEPEKLELMGPTYKDVVAANEAAMEGSGLHLFGNQWNIWDRIRRRLEPHENMFPGLENLPRMSVEQMRIADKAHGLTGHKNYSKVRDGDLVQLRPTVPISDYRVLRYFKRGGLAVKPRPRQKHQQHALSAKPRRTK
jgi:hypothetical protein